MRKIHLASLLSTVTGLVSFYLASPRDFRVFFAWPNGGVWSNLVASLPGAYAILWKLHWQHRQHMAEHHCGPQ